MDQTSTRERTLSVRSQNYHITSHHGDGQFILPAAIGSYQHMHPLIGRTYMDCPGCDRCRHRVVLEPTTDPNIGENLNGSELGQQSQHLPLKQQRTALLVIPVEETSMLEEHTSYHQCISGKEAKNRLRQHGRHCYLTRYSEAKGSYVLSVYQKSPTYTMKHFKIVIEYNGKKSIENKQLKFDTVGELLTHYENSRLDPAFRTIGLKYTEDDYMKSRRRRCIIL